MAEKTKEKKAKSGDRVEKKERKEKKARKDKKQESVAAKAFSLLADENAVNPALSSLFAAKPPPAPVRTATPVQKKIEVEDDEDVEDDEHVDLEPTEELITDELPDKKRKRKRRDADDDLEGAYLDKLRREEDRDAELAAAERAKKRQKGEADHAPGTADEAANDEEEVDASANVENDSDFEDVIDDEEEDDDDNAAFSPPKHETQAAADEELLKANRTVFLGNVSTTAIASKAARKTLEKHLCSFFDDLKAGTGDGEKHKLESLRFRSTPYATKIPKKAAFARKEVMDATTKSTNAYAVYSSNLLAREAAKRLNGTVVLDRHLRVDEVAHPAKIDHRRCVFVGNLGFVDDETNITRADAEDGREQRKPGKIPADVEEGLWRVFGKCGKVEGVRVVRDATTRVGKGVAYVQFEDQNGVESALLLDEKKFPPMLPRKLRVARAKAVKRNAKPGSGRPTEGKTVGGSGYQRKITSEEASRIGRAGKLYGRAAAAGMKKQPRGQGPKASGANVEAVGMGAGRLKQPEDFMVFEGHRAVSGSKPTMKVGGGKKRNKGRKPVDRSAKRAAAYKAKKGGV